MIPRHRFHLAMHGGFDIIFSFDPLRIVYFQRTGAYRRKEHHTGWTTKHVAFAPPRATQVLHLYQDERVLGILPFFHSFGYLVFWFVMFNDAGLVFHPSPIDAAGIGELVRRQRVTFLVTTPTFLQLYARRCSPEQFSSLRVALTGAEKLSLRVSQAFKDRFGIEPIEGYGVTECAPVIAVNCPDFRAAGYYQPASR